MKIQRTNGVSSAPVFAPRKGPKFRTVNAYQPAPDSRKEDDEVVGFLSSNVSSCSGNPFSCPNNEGFGCDCSQTAPPAFDPTSEPNLTIAQAVRDNDLSYTFTTSFDPTSRPEQTILTRIEHIPGQSYERLVAVELVEDYMPSTARRDPIQLLAFFDEMYPRQPGTDRREVDYFMHNHCYRITDIQEPLTRAVIL
jgi:hypothetical protein